MISLTFSSKYVLGSLTMLDLLCCRWTGSTTRLWCPSRLLGEASTSTLRLGVAWSSHVSLWSVPPLPTQATTRVVPTPPSQPPPASTSSTVREEGEGIALGDVPDDVCGDTLPLGHHLSVYGFNILRMMSAKCKKRGINEWVRSQILSGVVRDAKTYERANS